MQPPNDASDHLPINARLGRYEITSVLGQGGFGITYKAWDTTLKCHVAIKEYFPRHIVSRNPDSVSIRVLAPDTNAYQRGLKSFIEEARTLARFQHPGVVPVKDILQANDTAYLVMGFVEGITLGEYLKRHDGVIAPPALLNWSGQLLDALAQVHEAGLLHRDIKPDNIYIDEAEGRALLLDFGSSRRVVAEASHSITGVISPGYSPTEQYSESTRNQGPWSDLYSLSATLYRCITGHKPEEATIRQDEINNGEPDPLAALDPKAYPDFPEGFIQAVSRGLRIVRKERVQSVGEFVTLMEGGEGGKSGPGVAPAADSDKASRTPPQTPAAQASTPTPAPAVRSGPGKFGPKRALVALAVLAVALLGVGVWWLQSASAPDPVPLILDLTPPDARVTLLNAPAGTTYAPGVKLPPGVYKLHIAAENHQPLETTVDLAQKSGWAFSLEPKLVPLRITVTPSDARITLPDLPASATYHPGIRLPVGRHRVRIAAEGYQPLETTVDLAQKGEWAFNLEQRLVALRITVTPSDARITLLDLPASTTYHPGIRLPVGRHRVRIAAEGYQPLETTVDLAQKGEWAFALKGDCNLLSWNTQDFFKIATPGMVRDCLAAGADIHAKDDDGWTPLHLAAANTETPAILTTLLKAGADIHAKSDGWTPLHWAAVFTKTPAIITTLLNAGADIHAENFGGRTPLHVAAVFTKTPAILTTLLNAGADIHAKSDGYGWTPWDLAQSNDAIKGTSAYRRLRP